MGFNWAWFWISVVFCIVVAYVFAIAEALATDKFRRALLLAIIAAVVFCIAGGVIGGIGT